jgi:uncharacterized protein (UPF0248 family)
VKALFLARKNPLSDLLGKLQWQDLPFTLEIIHRGAPGDIKAITSSQVKKVGKKFFVTRQDTKIPLHRIKRVVDSKTGKTLWESSA